MDDRPLIHWGIPGMKWGVRKARNAISKAFAPKTTTKLQTKNGKTYLVKRTKGGDHLVSSLNRKSKELSRREVTPKQAKAFMDKQKSQKVKDIARADKVRTAGKVVGKVLSIYGVYKTAKFFSELNQPASPQYSPAYQAWLANG
jgi:hypothetical protein